MQTINYNKEKLLSDIGGDLEISFEKNHIFKKDSDIYPTNYNKKNVYYLDSGRSAIYLALEILKKKKY